MSTYFVGIDPGWSGGIAVVSGGKVLVTYPMPDSERGVYYVLEQRVKSLKVNPQGDRYQIRICLEKVGGYVPGSGGNIGSAMFEFGRNFGACLLSVQMLNVPYTLVTPAVWERSLGIPPRGTKSKEQHKKVLKERAQELYPDHKVTGNTADAILLAHYLSTL